ncbi:5-oxoprolinase subunit PxpA [Gelidibacter maritimus]|uniref:5-oxoprolinase subunit PxpA n=1 Tax=Gelidibacter maritimus TaxID=2761487 RepID=A0A7W2M4A0_9FLAO|nr:5-oxoprolinase subunit PxpA [Gelidibacter maritimus]MBA6152469.1 5-oxoprolinase subunit PxpA [Gelidibacter maritimus]
MSKENQIISVDINADVGEGLDNEAQLMPFLSSCNIACGGHAGNEMTMASVVKLAKRHQVKIGAHPSFPDKANFGRLAMDISSEKLLGSLKSQVNNLIKILKAENELLHHIKPHGALYNLANTEKTYAEVVISLMKHYDKSVKLYAPYGSIVSKMAEKNGITVIYEVFADRNYNDDLTLVSRSHPNALIEDAAELSDHVLFMLQHHKVKTISGTEKEIKVDTICIHGDHPQAEQHLQILTAELNKKGIQIK